LYNKIKDLNTEVDYIIRIGQQNRYDSQTLFEWYQQAKSKHYKSRKTKSEEKDNKTLIGLPLYQPVTDRLKTVFIKIS